MLNYAGEYYDAGMHEANAVPTRVLHNKATLPLMCAGV